MAERVSIVINTYNRAASLRRTLESLEQLEYPAFEVVVINGPSTDDTDVLLQKYGDRIKVGRCDHRNLSESRNIGIRLAAGEFVAFLDDDAYPDPAWLDRLVDGFDDDEVAAVGGPVYDHTGAALQARYSVATRLGDARVSEGPNPTAYLNVPHSQEFLYTIGTNTIFRYDRLVAVGGFDEVFEYYLDETDLCCRLVDRGWVVRALDDGFVYHKFLESDVRAPNRAIRSRYSVLKNKCYFALKHGLRTSSFYEVCQNLIDGVEHHRADYGWNVEHGLLSEADLVQFENDIHHAFNVGLQAFLAGERSRPPAWFAEETAAFKPFRARRVRADRLHICFLSQEHPPGPVNGIARLIHALASGLAADGHLVRVLTAGEGHDRVDLEAGVWVHRIVPRDQPRPEALALPDHLWNHSASMLEELLRVHEHRPIDIVEAPNWDSEAIAVLLDGRFRTVLGLYTTLSTVAEIDAHLASAAPVAAMLEAERFCYREATAFRAAETGVVDRIEAAYGVELAPDRVAVIPHGLPDATAGVQPERVEGAVNILFVGRLEKRKGIDVLLECVPELLSEFPDIVFTIVGDDTIPGDDGVPFRAAFEKMQSGLSDLRRVRFTGRTDDATRQRLYAGCDIFVAPSRSESFGLILVEAMMFGKPVIGGANSGMRSVVDVGGNGFLVPPGDAEALAGAIRDLVVSPELRDAFGRRSRQLFEERFALSRMVADSTSLYRRLVGPSPTGGPTALPTDRLRPDSAPFEAHLQLPKLPPEPIPAPGAAPSPTGFFIHMRCPVCHGDLRVDSVAVTPDGRLKTGCLVCLRCRAVAADVNHGKANFHARRPGVPTPPVPVVVPALGERRITADDPRLAAIGSWHQEGGFRRSDGRVGDALVYRGTFSDAVVRLLRHPWSGVVDVFLDDELVASTDLYMTGGSYVQPVSVGADLPFEEHSIAIRPRGAKDPRALGCQVLVEEIVVFGPKEAGFADPVPINRGNPFSSRIEQAIAAADPHDLILECGGGDRRRAEANHINFEYLEFEFADIYGDIHAVPFKDDTFDLVFSQAVFEHVRNPFDAAEELIRVTRPGGTIITEVAFLQPLHAVPYHFFNMTTWGVEELFRDCAIIESDWFGDLSVTVDWLVRSVNLPDKVPADRLSRIIGEFRDLDRLVSHDELKAVASGVYIVAQKRDSP